MTSVLIHDVSVHRQGGRFVVTLGDHMELKLSYGLAATLTRQLEKALWQESLGLDATQGDTGEA